MKIGVIGCGVVGGVLIKYLESRRSPRQLEIRKYDPRLGYSDSMAECNMVFISVPVPTNKNGDQDLGFIHEALTYCPSSAQIYIRSTVLPGTNDKLGTISMPEFLTERTAYQDFLKAPILCGYNNSLKELFPEKYIIHVSNMEAETIKYAHNTFGAMKVTYFNLINEICEKYNMDYQNILKGVLISGLINETHTSVPGPDGKTGYGGKCFPKDVRAFIKWINGNMDQDPYLFIKKIDDLNSRYRNE